VPTTIVLPDEDAVQEVWRHALDQEDYSEPMPSDLWHGSRADLALVLDPGSRHVRFVCIASKGKRIATRFSKVTLSKLHSFDPVPVDALLAQMPSQFADHLRAALQQPGIAVPPATWKHTVSALARLRPSLAEALERLRRQLQPDPGMSVGKLEVFAHQKDATGLALGIAGLGRSGIGSWQPVSDDDAPWLAGLAEGRDREDTLIIHDASRVPGWWPVNEPHVGVVRFADHRDNKLTVMNVNRTPVERATGVDLLYYRHKPASFVLVQYKRLVRRSTTDPATFRPSSDHNLDGELIRMRDIDALGQQGTDESGGPGLDPVAEYRLHPRASWLKLCTPDPFEPAGDALVPGMYLPLDFYDRLALDDLTLGPGGGRRLDRSRVPRWMSNTLFVQLVSESWIGSRGLHTDVLAGIVENALAGRRSVVLAQEERATPRSWR
jgi:hypothetical protein